MSGEFVISSVLSFLGSVSPQQKFEVTDESVLQLSFIWQAKEIRSKRCEEKRSPILAPIFMFVLPLSLAYANWASQEGCFT